MQIAINSRSTGRYTTEHINGREHIVTQMLSIEGDSIMNRLFYPQEEVSKSISQLDSLPAPVGHPTVNGQNVSAFHPLAINAHHFGGFVRRPRMEGKRVMTDLVIDVEVANAHEQGKEILRRIKESVRMGVSTGLNANVTNQKGNVGGQEFDGSVSDIKFDHVAVLLNESPAGENTFTLNSNVKFCEVKQPEKSKMAHEKLELDISALALPDRIALSNASANDLLAALNHQVTVEEATEIVNSAGLSVSKISNAQMNDFIANRDAFEAFKAKQKAERQEKVDFIVANSKMSEEELTGMEDSTLVSLVNSVTPKQNYTGATGGNAGGAELELL